jgi:hypothetical protein
VSDVSINGCWDVDNISVNLVRLEKFGDLNAVSQTMRGTDDHESSDAILLALGSEWLKMTLIELILRLSKVIVATEVAVRCERLLSNLDQLLIGNTISTVHVSINFETFTLLLELKETINNIVATWGCVTAEEDANLTSK